MTLPGVCVLSLCLGGEERREPETLPAWRRGRAWKQAAWVLDLTECEVVVSLEEGSLASWG